MTKADKIRRHLAKGTSVSEIAKRLGVSKNYVHVQRWKAHKKAQEDAAVKPEAKRKPGRPKKEKVVEQRWVDITYPGEALIPGSVPLPVDLVNHPPHYTAGGIETLDFIEAKDLNFRLGNAVKYIARAGKKVGGDPVQDLEKAAFYLKREIDARKGA